MDARMLKWLVVTLCALPAFAEEPAALKLKLAVLEPMFASPKYVEPALAPAKLRGDAVGAVCIASLCYDHHNGTSYKPSRVLMPEIGGLQREGISLKRDRVTFRYTFR